MDLTHSAFPIPALLSVIQTLKLVLGDVAKLGLMPQAQAWLVVGRLGRIVAKIDRMFLALRAGTLVVRGPRARTTAVVTERCEKADLEAPVGTARWPRRSMWLVRWAGHEAAGMGSQFAALLRTPEMVELLLAAPQAARVLRPMCRMLGVAPSLLDPRLPEPVFVPVEERVRPKRVRKKAPPVDWGRIPLPRGVLSAARRAGFKTVRPA